MRTLLVVLGLSSLWLTPYIRRRTRRPFSGQTGRPRLLVWETASRAQNGQRGVLLTAAIDGSAPLFPLGTKVKVTNLRTKQQVVVTINSRRPFTGKKRRIIDLSEAAAKRIGIRERGTERVEVVVVENAP
jgi:hypothetical protein